MVFRAENCEEKYNQEAEKAWEQVRKWKLKYGRLADKKGKIENKVTRLEEKNAELRKKIQQLKNNSEGQDQN